MQKLPEASDRERGDACAKKRNRPEKRKNVVLIQQWQAEWQHLDLVLLMVEGAMRPSNGDVLANLSTSKSRLFYYD